MNEAKPKGDIMNETIPPTFGRVTVPPSEVYHGFEPNKPVPIHVPQGGPFRADELASVTFLAGRLERIRQLRLELVEAEVGFLKELASLEAAAAKLKEEFREPTP